jgi:hypothetical protein
MALVQGGFQLAQGGPAVAAVPGDLLVTCMVGSSVSQSTIQSVSQSVSQSGRQAGRQAPPSTADMKDSNCQWVCAFLATLPGHLHYCSGKHNLNRISNAASAVIYTHSY